MLTLIDHCMAQLKCDGNFLSCDADCSLKFKVYRIVRDVWDTYCMQAAFYYSR